MVPGVYQRIRQYEGPDTQNQASCVLVKELDHLKVLSLKVQASRVSVKELDHLKVLSLKTQASGVLVKELDHLKVLSLKTQASHVLVKQINSKKVMSLEFHSPVSFPGGMVRTETYLQSQSSNGLLVDWSTPIKVYHAHFQ